MTTVMWAGHSCPIISILHSWSNFQVKAETDLLSEGRNGSSEALDDTLAEGLLPYSRSHRNPL